MPWGTFGVHGASGAFGTHGRLRATPLATNCWPKAPRGGGGGAGVVGVLGPAESPPPGVPESATGGTDGGRGCAYGSAEVPTDALRGIKGQSGARGPALVIVLKKRGGGGVRPQAPLWDCSVAWPALAGGGALIQPPG